MHACGTVKCELAQCASAHLTARLRGYDACMQMTITEARNTYRTIRSRVCFETGVTPEAFDAACRTWLARETFGFDVGGEAWCRAAESVSVRCGRCAGTGHFRAQASAGECYRCQGRGRQTYADVRRNYGADVHALDRAARA